MCLLCTQLSDVSNVSDERCPSQFFGFGQQQICNLSLSLHARTHTLTHTHVDLSKAAHYLMPFYDVLADNCSTTISGPDLVYMNSNRSPEV